MALDGQFLEIRSPLLVRSLDFQLAWKDLNSTSALASDISGRPSRVINESVDFFAIKSHEPARQLLRRVPGHSKLNEDQALAGAPEQVEVGRRKTCTARP